MDRPTGIALAATEQPCFILRAVQPPRMDGCKVTRGPSFDTELSRTPIVVVTSHAMMAGWGYVMEAGCEGCLEKPINLEAFIADNERHLCLPNDGDNP